MVVGLLAVEVGVLRERCQSFTMTGTSTSGTTSITTCAVPNEVDIEAYKYKKRYFESKAMLNLFSMKL